VDASGLSDTGLARSHNEDAIWLDETGFLFLLADGMGGHERGAEASATAVRVIREMLNPETVKERCEDITALMGVPSEIACIFPIVEDAVEAANSTIYERNQELGLERYMGTTLVGMILVEGGHVLWFHVGDSRLYRFRDTKLECITTDHSAHAEWVRQGLSSNEPSKNIITRAVGPGPFVQPDTGWGKRRSGDTYLLCSDGLTDMISDDEIEGILSAETTVDAIASRLVDAANQAGGKDNTSVLICRV
jgi:PPM family protein phosphatase